MSEWLMRQRLEVQIHVGLRVVVVVVAFITCCTVIGNARP
jgi:hypothetical protein